MATKQFSTGQIGDDGQPKPPVDFDIDGETFQAVPVPPAEALLAVFRSQAETGRSGASVLAIYEYLDLVLIDESAERFAARLRSKENPIDNGTVNDLFRWLNGEVYAARPTGRSNGSSAGPSTGGPESTDAAPSQASTL